MSIKDHLQNIKSTLPKHVTLVAVSKTKPITDLMEAYNAGQRVFGENKIQEMTVKYEALPKDIAWHMIGHVQKNKVKYFLVLFYLGLLNNSGYVLVNSSAQEIANKFNQNINKVKIKSNNKI